MATLRPWHKRKTHLEGDETELITFWECTAVPGWEAAQGQGLKILISIQGFQITPHTLCSGLLENTLPDGDAAMGTAKGAL